MTTVDQPDRADMERLFDLAVRIRDMAPWEWMEETDIFGVQDPASGETAYVSIMGTLGEYLAVSALLGSRALYDFWGIEDDEANFWPPDHVVNLPQIQLAFVTQDELQPHDRALLRLAGQAAKKGKLRPVFRSYRPGYVPWQIERAEALLMAHVLEQTLDVASRVKNSPSILEPGDDEMYLVRVPVQQDGQTVWQDDIRQAPEPIQESFEYSVDEGELQRLKSLPPSTVELEVDLAMLPSQVREKDDDRPRFPYLLLIVDAQSRFVYKGDMLAVESSVEAMWADAGSAFQRVLSEVNVVPKTVTVATGFMLALLSPLASELGFRLQQAESLPVLDEIRDLLLESLSSD